MRVPERQDELQVCGSQHSPVTWAFMFGTLCCFRQGRFCASPEFSQKLEVTF